MTPRLDLLETYIEACETYTGSGTDSEPEQIQESDQVPIEDVDITGPLNIESEAKFTILPWVWSKLFFSYISSFTLRSLGNIQPHVLTRFRTC